MEIINSLKRSSVSHRRFYEILGLNLTTLLDLVQHHHKLMRTTVTEIPMKEEAKEKDSKPYEVPILHPQLGNSTERLR